MKYVVYGFNSASYITKREYEIVERYLQLPRTSKLCLVCDGEIIHNVSKLEEK